MKEVDYKIFKLKQEENGFVRIDSKDWVCVVPILHNGDGSYSTVLVNQYRFGIKENSVEFPSGVFEEGETPLEAGIRELKEETGLVFSDYKEVLSEWYYANPAFLNNKIHFIFLSVKDFSFGEQKLDPTENISIERVDFNKDTKKFAEIKHAYMSIAMVRAYAILHEQNMFGDVL